jgi:hypothetical protein
MYASPAVSICRIEPEGSVAEDIISPVNSMVGTTDWEDGGLIGDDDEEGGDLLLPL